MTEATENTLTCNEAKLLLRTIPSELKLEEKTLTKEQWLACLHYVTCEDCRKHGLVAILNLTISCQDALIAWAHTNIGKYFLGTSLGSPATLQQQMAKEHIFGRGGSEIGSCYSEMLSGAVGACKEELCASVFQFVKQGGWTCAPSLSSMLRIAGSYHHFLTEAFYAQRWDVAPILCAHREQMLDMAGDDSELLELCDELYELVAWHSKHAAKIEDVETMKFWRRLHAKMLDKTRVKVDLGYDSTNVDHFIFPSLRGLAAFVEDRSDGVPPLNRFEPYREPDRRVVAE